MPFRLSKQFILILSVSVLVITAFVVFRLYHAGPSVQKIEQLRGRIDAVVRDGGSSVRSSRDKKITVWRVELKDRPVFDAHLAVQKEIENAGARIVSSRLDPASGRMTLEIGWREPRFRVILSPPKPAPAKGRIALIIDDFGDRWDEFTQSFCDLDGRVTVSILPGRRHSTDVADEMAKRGMEVFLHLPMEPKEAQFKDDGNIILSHMARSEIRKVLSRALDDVPGAVGINNHMGSKVTADRETTTLFMEELLRTGLIFVDSRTIGKSVAFDLARSMGIRSVKKDRFIDNSPADVRPMLWELARIAGSRGRAVGIGHARQSTLNVLKVEMPKLRAKGYRFVPVSEIAG